MGEEEEEEPWACDAVREECERDNRHNMTFEMSLFFWNFCECNVFSEFLFFIYLTCVSNAERVYMYIHTCCRVIIRQVNSYLLSLILLSSDRAIVEIYDSINVNE